MTSLIPLHRIVRMSYGWFDSLPERIRHDIQTRAVQRRLVPGERLFDRGGDPNCIFGVIEGSVRLSGLSIDGRETVLDFFGPGSWFGDVSMLDGLPRAHDAEAHEAALVMQLEAPAFEDLLATYPQFSRALLRFGALRQRLLLMALEQYSALSLEQRLASRLLMLAGPFGKASSRGLRIDLHLSQEALAQLIGSTRQRVSQILKVWETESIIEQQYGTIVVLAEDRLEKLAMM